MRLSVLLSLIAASSARAYSTPQQQPLTTTPCDFLSTLFPGQVLYPGEANYTLGQAAYWSAQQSDLKPSCRFFPRHAGDIQQALADVVLPHQSRIAVSSGGHSSVQGASNVDRGITFDLSSLTYVNWFLDAGKAAWLGVGSRWEDVYELLEGSNLTVAGGRTGHVGVGGHALGGGLSWYANSMGWASDTIAEIEVVTPQAEILTVNEHKNEDLFWALKGSLGAFGIVTKIKMNTAEHNGVYGGALTYQQKYAPRLCNALDNLAREADKDLSTQGYVTFRWVEAQKAFTYSAYLMNTEGKSWNGALSRFKAIPHSSSSLRTMTISESAREIDKSNPVGLRRSGFTLTGRMSTTNMMALHELVKSFTSKIQFDQEGILGVTFQPLTVPHLSAQTNFFNTNPIYGPLLLASVELWWKDASRDEYFSSTTNDLRLAMEAELERRQALHPFIYPNYASKEQDPWKSLAPLDKQRLTAIKQKYDGNDAWRDVMPGIWHI